MSSRPVPRAKNPHTLTDLAIGSTAALRVLRATTNRWHGGAPTGADEPSLEHRPGPHGSPRFALWPAGDVQST